MTCTAKHTKYQPTPDEWKCPKCDAETDFYNERTRRIEDGWIIQDPAEGSGDCDLNHAADTIGCGACGYGCSGSTFARNLQKAHNLVECTHCKGKGLVRGKQ